MLCAIAPLLVDEAGFAETGIADDLLEARAVELAVGPAETRIAGDAARDLGVGKAKAQLARILVERGLGDDLAENLPVEAEPARLVGRDRPSNLAPDLLQAVGVELAELLDRNFGVADLGHRVAPETAENVADAPDRKAHDQQAHDDRQDGLAEPVRGGFVNTAEHGLRSSRVAVKSA